ncbi:MAG: choice-of-anchor Q domain-containing protein [Actinomycetes bacterium]
MNGGPTQTRALGVGSPAIDAGPSTFSFPGDSSDQRGTPSLRISGGAADLGAFEVQPEPTPPGPDPVPQPTPEPTPEPEPTFTG